MMLSKQSVNLAPHLFRSHLTANIRPFLPICGFVSCFSSYKNKNVQNKNHENIQTSNVYYSYSCTSSYAYTYSSYRFCTRKQQKDNNNTNNSKTQTKQNKQKQEHKADQSTKNQQHQQQNEGKLKQEQKSNEHQNGQPKKTIKLVDMSIEQLLEINSDDSLRIAHRKIADLQKQQKRNQQVVTQLEQKLTYFEKHHNQLTDKQQKLLSNLKIQENQLTLIHKRSTKQVQDSKDYAIAKLARQLIETADNIKRCRQYAEQIIKQNSQNSQDQYLTRIILSDKQMINLLKLYDIQEFDPTGKPFDPNTSQSLVTIPCPPGYEVNNVAMAMQTGYKIKNRVLRSARVGIFV